MAAVAKDVRDPGLLVAHAQDDGFDFPVIHAKLEFHDGGDKFIPVLTFCPIIDDKKDEESQRRLADKLRSIVMEHIKLPLRVQWDANGELLGIVVKEGKVFLLPLPKQIIKPDEGK